MINFIKYEIIKFLNFLHDVWNVNEPMFKASVIYFITMIPGILISFFICYNFIYIYGAVSIFQSILLSLVVSFFAYTIMYLIFAGFICVIIVPLLNIIRDEYKESKINNKQKPFWIKK